MQQHFFAIHLPHRVPHHRCAKTQTDPFFFSTCARANRDLRSHSLSLSLSLSLTHLQRCSVSSALPLVTMPITSVLSGRDAQYALISSMLSASTPSRTTLNNAKTNKATAAKAPPSPQAKRRGCDIISNTAHVLHAYAYTSSQKSARQRILQTEPTPTAVQAVEVVRGGEGRENTQSVIAATFFPFFISARKTWGTVSTGGMENVGGRFYFTFFQLS